MGVFSATLNQLAFLFGIILIGYILMKSKIIDNNATGVLSKLENMLFMPALIMGTFIKNFTVASIQSAWKLFLMSFLILLFVIPIALITARLVTKDKYLRNIYTYGLSFSNFGFMGNAVVSSLFPDIFLEYVIFTIPLWILIYLWGVPELLIADANKKQTLKERIKVFLNPMFIGMVIGMVIGLIGLKMPIFITSIIDAASNCMSPVAMLLTGMAIAEISLKKSFTDTKTYIISFVRLAAIPFLFILIAQFISMPREVYICALCSLAMPLGMNTIVIPSAYGKDTTAASSMLLISHLLSVITIPLIFIFIK